MTNTICIAPGCEAGVDVKKSGLCQPHYNRMRVYGDLNLTPPNKVCKGCGREVERTGKHGPWPSYCTSQCRDQSWRNRNREKLAADLEESNAERRAENAKKRASTIKSCKHCSDEFVPEKSLAQSFCSGRCSKNFHRDNSGKLCSEPGCERPFRAREMCSMHYRRWARATGLEKNPVWDERRKANWKKRNALTRGAVNAESFEYSEIYDRDGWICGICDEPVDSSLEWPDPMSKSLDHIVPVTRGGSHTRDNAQCSHLFCNVSKGNSVRVDAMSA